MSTTIMSKSFNSKSTTSEQIMKLIEIIRSKYGYGFTLSGEMPCRLTHVKGHARSGGLRSGDRLHIVNGQNVDTFTHDQVVELITSIPDGRLLLHVSAASTDDSLSSSSSPSSSSSSTLSSCCSSIDENNDKQKPMICRDNQKQNQRQFNSSSAKIATSTSKSMMIDVDRKSSISLLTTSTLPNQQQSSKMQKYRSHRNTRHHHHRNNHRTIPRNHHNYHTKKHRSIKNNQCKRQQQQEPQSSTTTILSPSETYQDESQISSSRYHYRNKPRFKDYKRNYHHQNRYHKNGDQSCNSDGDIYTNVAEHFEGLWKRASSQTGTLHQTQSQKPSFHSFKSIDSLLDRFPNHDNHKDCDESMLHQHFRNHKKLENKQILLNIQHQQQQQKQQSFGDAKEVNKKKLFQIESDHQMNDINSFKVDADVHHHHHQVQPDYHNNDGKLFALSSKNLSMTSDQDLIPNEQQLFIAKKNELSKTKTNSTSGFSSISPSSSTSISPGSSPTSTTERLINETKIQPNIVNIEQHLLMQSSKTSPPELFISNASTTTTLSTDPDQHSQAIFRSIVECIRIVRYRNDHNICHDQWINIQSIFDHDHHTSSSEIIDDDESNFPLLIAIYPCELYLFSYKINCHIRAKQIIQCQLLWPTNKEYFVLIIRDDFDWIRAFIMKVSSETWQSHQNHHQIASLLSIKCTPDPIAKNHCLEFPENCEPILRTIYTLYRRHLTNNNNSNNNANNNNNNGIELKTRSEMITKKKPLNNDQQATSITTTSIMANDQNKIIRPRFSKMDKIQGRTSVFSSPSSLTSINMGHNLQMKKNLPKTIYDSSSNSNNCTPTRIEKTATLSMNDFTATTESDSFLLKKQFYSSDMLGHIVQQQQPIAINEQQTPIPPPTLSSTTVSTTMTTKESMSNINCSGSKMMMVESSSVCQSSPNNHYNSENSHSKLLNSLNFQNGKNKASIGESNGNNLKTPIIAGHIGSNNHIDPSVTPDRLQQQYQSMVSPCEQRLPSNRETYNRPKSNETSSKPNSLFYSSPFVVQPMIRKADSLTKDEWIVNGNRTIQLDSSSSQKINASHVHQMVELNHYDSETSDQQQQHQYYLLNVNNVRQAAERYLLHHLRHYHQKNPNSDRLNNNNKKMSDDTDHQLKINNNNSDNKKSEEQEVNIINDKSSLNTDEISSQQTNTENLTEKMSILTIQHQHHRPPLPLPSSLSSSQQNSSIDDDQRKSIDHQSSMNILTGHSFEHHHHHHEHSYQSPTESSLIANITDNRYLSEQQQLRKQIQTGTLSIQHEQGNNGDHKKILEQQNLESSFQKQSQNQQQQLMTNSTENDNKINSNNEKNNESKNTQLPSKNHLQLQHQKSVAVDEYFVMDGSSPPPPTSTSYLLHHHLDQEHKEKHDERPIDVGWVGGWASDFDILLRDSIGIKAFTDFLRKEFSYENLQFFLAVQNFKKLTDSDEIRKKSQEIYDKFIALSAPDPVNVDSRARKSVESGLSNPNNRIFLLAEEQIYNLMKFDSYVRFLKSDIYEKCSILDLKGESLPYENDDAIVGDTICDTLLSSTSSANAISTSGRSGHNSGKNNPAAVKKRRSFIPWARLKSSINHKASSLSSMTAPSSTKAEMFGSKKQYMMRKLTNSIHKIRSKSLDEHLTNHVNNKTQHLIGSETQSHNSSIDKSSIISNGQKNPFNSTSRSSLMPHSSDSIDSSDHNVFPPSPDNMKSVEIIDASCSPPTSIPTAIEHLKSHSESDPVSPAKSLSLAMTTTLSSTSTANLPNLPSSASSSSFNHNCNRDNCHFLRIVFPDRSQTVVPSSPNETLNNLLKKLFEKRSLKYLAWDVFITGNEKPLDLSTNTTQLGCVELRVEQRVIFRVEFPSQDIIGVKTRPTKLCSEIFHPLLIRYGYRPEHTVMTIAETEQIVPQMSPVSVLDGQHIVVSYFDDLEEWGWDTTRNNIPVALSLAGKSFSEDSSMKSKKKDEKSMDGHALIDQQQQASSVPSVATYHNLGSIRDHLLASRYIAAKNNQSNNLNLECSPQLDSYESPTNTSSSTPGDDTQSDIFFRELMKTAHTIPSPPRGPSLTSTYSAAYGIINSSSPPNETTSNRSQQSQTPISNTNRIPYRTSNNSSQQQQRNQSLRDLQNHRHFKSYQPSPLSYEPVTVPRSLEMARKQIMSENELGQSISSNSSPSINTLPLDLPNHRHKLNSQPITTQESNKLNLLQPQKPPLRRQKSDPPTQPPPLPPKSTNTTNLMMNTNNITTNTICPPRPPPRTSIFTHRNQSLTSDNCQNQSSSITMTNPSDSSLA